MTTNVVQLARPAVPRVLEAQLLGAVLELGQPPLKLALELIETAGVLHSQFEDRRIGVCWKAAHELAMRGKDVSAATVFSVVRVSGDLQETESEWLQGVENANSLTRESFGIIAEQLRTAILGRAVGARMDVVSRTVKSGNFSKARVGAELDSLRDLLARSDIRNETAASDVIELDSKWEHRENTGTSPILPSRIKLLDETLGGGFPPKLTVIAGQPGVGKNQLLAGMIRAQLEADPNLKIGLFALEDGSRWLLKRWMAEELGMTLPEVGVKKRTEETMHRYEEAKVYFHKLLERVPVFRWGSITPAELMMQSQSMIAQHEVGEIVVDNFTRLNLSPEPEQNGRRQHFAPRHEVLGHAIQTFAELADRKELPFVGLAHTVRPESQRGDSRPPSIYEVAGTANIERVIRCFLGLWRTQSRELRLTVGKNNEGPGVGTHIELELIKEAATIVPGGGKYINLEREARDARDAREQDKEDRLETKRKKRDAKRAAEKAAFEAEAAKNAPPPPPPPAPQLMLMPEEAKP